MLHTHSFTYHPRYVMFLSQYFSFHLSVPFHQCSVLIWSLSCSYMKETLQNNGGSVELSGTVGEGGTGQTWTFTIERSTVVCGWPYMWQEASVCLQTALSVSYGQNIQQIPVHFVIKIKKHSLCVLAGGVGLFSCCCSTHSCARPAQTGLEQFITVRPYRSRQDRLHFNLLLVRTADALFTAAVCNSGSFCCSQLRTIPPTAIITTAMTSDLALAARAVLSLYQYDRQVMWSCVGVLGVRLQLQGYDKHVTDGTHEWTSDRGKETNSKDVVTDTSTVQKEHQLAEGSQASSARPSGSGGSGCGCMEIEMYEKWWLQHHDRSAATF